MNGWRCARRFGAISITAALTSFSFLSSPPAALAQSVPRGVQAGATMCACPGHHKPLGNNPNCEDACYGPRSSDSSIDHSGAEEAGRQARRWFDCKLLNKNCPVEQLSPVEQAHQQRLAEAYAANERGVQLYKNKEWAKAVTAFEEAVNKSPDDITIRRNLDNAQAALRDQEIELEGQRQAKASAARMQQSIQGLAQSFTVAPAAGGASGIAAGLDFDGRDAPNSPAPPNIAANSGGLAFSTSIAPAAPAAALSPDVRVVDARKVPSGLPRATENAIAVAYANAPAGVSDRVRKGFQAVMTSDWNVAKAWFQDALKLDPDNAALKRLATLTDATEVRKTQAAVVKNNGALPAKPVLPASDAELAKFFENFRNGTPFKPTDAVLKRVMNLSNQEFSRLLWTQLPTQADMDLLFDLSSAAPAARPAVGASAVLQLPTDDDLNLLFGPGLPPKPAPRKGPVPSNSRN